MKKNYAFIITLLVASFGFGQTTIHCWDFNGTAPGGNFNTSPINTDNRVTGDGAITHNITDAENFGGNSSNACSGSSSGAAFCPRPGSSLVNNGNHFTLEFSTLGFENIVLTFYVQKTSSGFNSNQLSYSTNGGSSFTNFGSPFDPSSNIQTFDFSSIPAVNNNPDFQIRITLNGGTGSSGNNRYDNIKLEGDPVPTNDTDTEIAAPTSGQVTTSTIIAANTTSAINAVPVFRFNIEDQGTTDGLPTNVTRMRFVPGANNTADWTDHIQDIVMTNVTDAIDLTPLTTVTINDLEIIVDYGPPVVIIDNGFKEFEVSIYLNVDEILDGAVVQMEIPAVGSGFQADSGGSTFLEPQPGTLTGPQMPIDVVGTGLEFDPQPLPSQAGLNQQMPLFDVLAVDSNGNLDLDYGQTIDITSSGTLDASPVSQMATNGVASFNSVTHTALGTGIQLTAADDSMPTQLTGMSSSFDVVVLPICLAFQSFGADGGDWSFITDPATFNGADVWDVVDSSFRSFATIASDGAEFFGVQDLASPSGTAIGEFGEIEFSQVDVSIYENVVVSFDYEVDGYDTGDDIEYELFVDGVSQGRVLLVDGFSNLDQDGTVSIPVINNAANISLIIYIKQNGDDYAGLDNFKVIGTLPSIVYEGNDSNGFGGPLGEGDLEIDAFTGTTADFTLIKGPGAFGNNNDQMVIYIDSQAGGITNTGGLTDDADPGRSAISGVGLGGNTNQAILNFPPGFEADFAIAVDENFAGLFEIVEGGSHTFITSAGLSPTGNTASATFNFSIDFADINTTAGSGSFKFLATYINPNDAFRSNEFIGDSDYNNNALGNPGQTTVDMDTYFQVSDRIKGGRASSAASGNWSDDATWTNGNAPLEGDVITVNHDIAQDVSYSSSNNLGSESIEITGANTLTVNAGSTLEMRDGINGTGNLVVNGTLSLTQGGFTDITPTYNTFSTLEYRDITGTYNRFNEWLAGSAGPGVPDNVIINNVDLDLSNPSGDTSDESFATIDDLTLLNGANLNIDATKNLTVGDDLTNTGSSVIMTSTSTRYPSLIVQGSATGNVTYNRHVNDAPGTGTSTTANDLISPPVGGMTFLDLRTANANILSGNVGGAGPFYLFGPFDNSSAVNDYVLFEEVVDDGENIVPGVGYRTGSTDGGTYEFTGTLQTTNLPVSITTPSGGSIWNAIGNPFTSYITLSEFLSINSTVFDVNSAGIYGYDGEATNGWTVWDDLFLLLNPNAVITPGQGFFVASQAGGTTVNFNTDMRTTGTATDDDFIIGRASSAITNVKIDLTTANNDYSTSVFFTEFSSLGLDPGFDSSLFGGSAPAFAIYTHLVAENNGIPFGIQALGKTDYGDTVVPLGVNASQGEQLTFNMSENTLPIAVEVYLDDSVANTSTLLNSGDYVLTPSTNLSGTGRFYLRFSNSALSTSENSLDDITIYADQNNRKINISGQLKDGTIASVYDIQGRMILSKVLSSNSTLQTIDSGQINTGIYIVKLSNGDQYRTEKIILK